LLGNRFVIFRDEHRGAGHGANPSH